MKTTAMLFFPDPCEDSPCHNGGTCHFDDSQKHGFRCHCPEHYTGPECEVVNKKWQGEISELGVQNAFYKYNIMSFHLLSKLKKS